MLHGKVVVTHGHIVNASSHKPVIACEAVHDSNEPRISVSADMFADTLVQV